MLKTDTDKIETARLIVQGWLEQVNFEIADIESKYDSIDILNKLHYLDARLTKLNSKKTMILEIQEVLK